MDTYGTRAHVGPSERRAGSLDETIVARPSPHSHRGTDTVNPTHLLIPALLCLASVRAQEVRIPAGARFTEQNDSIRFDESLPSPLPGTRLTQIGYGSAELAGVGPRIWNEIELRPDQVGFAAQTATIAIRLSAIGVPEPAGLTSIDRNANRGWDAVTVVRSRVVMLPSVAIGSGGVPQRSIRIPFDVPYSYPGSSPLLVEIEWTAGPGASWPAPAFDALRPPRVEWRVAPRLVAPGCAPAGSFRFAVGTASASNSLVLVAEFAGIGVSATSPTVLLFGGTAASLPLGAIGAPGCTLGLGVDAIEAANLIAVPGGAVHWRVFEIPFDRSLVGGRLVGQAMVADTTANALGQIFSDAIEVTVVDGPNERRAGIVQFATSSGPAPLPVREFVPVVTLR
jgi:hypothetical protein